MVTKYLDPSQRYGKIFADYAWSFRNIALYVHEPELYGPSQMSFFENVLRKHTDLRGAPVRIVVRKV